MHSSSLLAAGRHFPKGFPGRNLFFITFCVLLLLFLRLDVKACDALKSASRPEARLGSRTLMLSSVGARQKWHTGS